METGPASLGFDPTFEVADRFFEAGDRGLNWTDPPARFGDDPAPR
jgi:hypothetical protein